jgi:hypothetical protein
VSSDPGCACAAGARRGAVRRRADARGAARFALRLAVRFMPRLAGRLTVRFFADLLFEPLRDFAAVRAAFRRFLAMRAPPDEWARVFYLIS